MTQAVATLSLEGLSQWAGQARADLRGPLFTKALKISRLLLVEQERECFAGGHAPDGQAWPRLAHERPRGGDQPLRDRGFLMASTTANGRGHVETMTDSYLDFGTNLEYAALHQWGGTIRPKHAKALAIPLTKEAAKYSSPRDFPRALGMVSRAGHPPLLVENKKETGSKGAQAIFHYVLKASVTIPARPFLGIGGKLADKVGRAFADVAGDVL